MRRTHRIEIAVVLGLVASFAFGPRAGGQASARKGGLPDVVSATDIAYPMNTTTTGLVSLLLTLDITGTVQNTLVLQDTPPLTATAQASVQNWTFKAAVSPANAPAVLLAVHVVFNPYNPGGTSPVGGGLTPPAVPLNGGSAVPPQIVSASYAIYPSNALATGTVVLSLRIDKSGNATQVKVVHGVPPLTDAAMTAVRQWGFQPATFGGRPVAGRICIAFVFQRNLS